jgi:hypothetical protein
MKLKNSDFKFVKYEIKKMNIECFASADKPVEYGVEMQVSDVEYKKDLAYFGIRLLAIGKTGEEKINQAEIEIFGLFRGLITFEKETFENFCYTTGLVNLLQNARSSILSASSVMNMKPSINLPLFNLNESFKVPSDDKED